VSQVALTDFAPSEVLRTRTFYLMWIAYALGTSAGLMVMSQVVPFAKSVGIAGGALSAMTLVIGACGNAMGRTFSGWMSDRAGRIIVLRAMIGLIAIAMAGRQLRHALHRIRPSGTLGPRIGGVLYDRHRNYQAAFYTASALAVVALLCEFGAKRPAQGERGNLSRSISSAGV